MGCLILGRRSDCSFIYTFHFPVSYQMHLKLNTSAYLTHYKMLVRRYEQLNKGDVCEPRIRKLCEIIHQSNLGVSVYSCEGHEGDYPSWDGYVMLAARNRDAASKLLEIFQVAFVKAVEEFGAEGIGVIENCIATWNSINTTYPCIVVRNPPIETELIADLWWELITETVLTQLKPYINVSPVHKKAA